MGMIDWLIILVYGCLMAGIGFYYSRMNRTADDFLLGGRRLSPIALGLSLFASMVSTLSYLASPGEMIAHGPMMMTQSLAQPLVFAVVGYVVIPRLMRQQVTSAYELLEARLGLGIRRAGAAVFLLLRLGWMATIIYATCHVVLGPLLGIDPIWTPWLCVLLGIVAATYSSLGGIKAAVMTDTIQSLTMLAGAITTVSVISIRMGGITAWWPHQWPAQWQTPHWGFDLDARVSFGVLMISTTLWYVCTTGSDQMSIQRFLANRNPSAARQTLAVSLVTDVIVSLVLGLTGLAISGFYQAYPPPMASGQQLSEIADQLFPKFILTEMSGGLAGLVLAAILSASLSSLSSGINSASAVVVTDFLENPSDQPLAADAAVKRLKRLAWLIALVAVAISLLNFLIKGNLLERCFKVVNLLTAPLFVLFFLALFVKWANATGAWLGLLASSVVAVLIAYSKELGLGHNLSFIWIMPCSLLVGAATGAISSALIPSKSRERCEKTF